MAFGISAGGILQALAMLGKKIPGYALGGRAASRVGSVLGKNRVFRKSPIEPFIQRHKGGKFQPYERGQWKGKVGDAGEEGKIVGKGWVGKEGMKQGAMEEGDWRIIEAILKRPRNLAKAALAGTAFGAYNLWPEDEMPIPEWAEDLADAEEPELADNMDIADVEELSDVPSWLRPVLASLGAWGGYKRGGLTGGLMGGVGGYGMGELLERNPGMYEWIRKNPQVAAILGLAGADALGLDKGFGGGSSDIPEYQPYTPLTYDNLGGYAPSTEVPQMQGGAIIGALKRLYDRRFGEEEPDFNLPSGLLPENLPGEGWKTLPGKGWDTQPDSSGRWPGLETLPGEGWPWKRSPYALPDSLSREESPGWRTLPGRGWDTQPDSSSQRPTPFATPMAQGGIAGGASGLGGLRTGLRDAIVNSIDDPNRQGVNSFVPSMLKAYDEIPKLQQGGITKGGDATRRNALAPPPPAQPVTQTMGTVPLANTYATKPDWEKTQQHQDPNLYNYGDAYQNVDSSGMHKRTTTAGNVAPGVTPRVTGPTVPTGPDYGVSGVGSGYDPMTAAVGQNILEKRAAMGGLGSNMTDISLARGMAPHMAGMQNQWYNQQMGMQGFNQRERENMARFGMQRAALENQGGVSPYAQRYWSAGG